MNQEYFEQWGEVYKNMQKPMQEFAKLNMKALEELKENNFEALFDVKKPQEVIELQLDLAVKNGQKTLDYMKKSLEIFERSTKEFTNELKTKEKK
jgi:phasin family protein